MDDGNALESLPTSSSAALRRSSIVITRSAGFDRSAAREAARNTACEKKKKTGDRYLEHAQTTSH
jgi:hypothetical protein